MKFLNRFNVCKKGSVTVFLVMIFSVLLLLLVAAISLLCYQAEKTNVDRTLNVAVEAEFSKFYRPLFERYGLFYYIETDEEEIPANIMSYFMKNQEGISRMLKVEPEHLSVVDKNYAIDYGAVNVYNQMSQGIVYTLGEEAVNDVLGNLEDNINTQNDSNNINNEVREEYDSLEKAADVDRDVLALLKLVEGITIDESGIQCSEYYVKKGIPGTPDAANAGVDSVKVWEEVSEYSFDVGELLYKLQDGEYNAQNVTKWCKELKEIKKCTIEALELLRRIENKLSALSDYSCICNVNSFISSIGDNLFILDELLNIERNHDDSYIEYCIELLGSYHVRDLWFDYSSLEIDNAYNPLNEVDRNINGMISFLISDVDDISNKSIREADLYRSLIDERSEYLDDKIKFGLYINHHFSDFLEEINDDYNRALMYEKEYLISGKRSDEDNLNSVINKMLLMRTGVGFAYLVSDHESKSCAYAAATAIVGFTGMDALIRTTQYAILAVWAYEDACIDTSALINGYKVKYKKDSSNMNMRFSELPLFNREYILAKVNSWSNETGAGYGEYLQLMLAGTSESDKLYRAMDIIQYNLKKYHSNLFSFQHAVYRVNVGLLCNKPYRYSTESEYCYK